MYRSINDVLKEKYGCKVYKIALSTGCTCPNRDGTVGVGGCIFCNEKGSGDFAGKPFEPVSVQLKKGKELIRRKVKDGKFIAYFQSFTNTYSTPERLEPLFMEAIRDEEVVALSIATRPDCLPEEMLMMLSGLVQIKPVWVELGLQTIHPGTASYIRRGYELIKYDEAVRNLKSIGAEVVVHVIIGLPGEDKEMMKETVRYVVQSKADGIKLQLLHVLKNTDLEKEYKEGKVPILSMEEYVDILSSCVEEIPESVVIHRLTGDGKKSELVAPLWSADKRKVLNAIHREFQKRGLMMQTKKEIKTGICYIAGAGEFCADYLSPGVGDFVVAADGGFAYLQECGIKPDLAIGDFDSLGEIPNLTNVVKYPERKDDTDLELAMKEGYEQGYRLFKLYGVCGMRPDHTIANIQMAYAYARKGCVVFLFGKGYTYLITSPGTISFPKAYKGTVSVFSLAGRSEGITISGLEYEIGNSALTNTYPLGVSNAFCNRQAKISFQKGVLMIIWYSNDNAMLPLPRVQTMHQE